MGVPVVLDGGGTIDPFTLTFDEQIAWARRRAGEIVGPRPELPYYESVTVQGGDEHTNTSGPFGGVGSKPDIPADYPNAGHISSDFQALLASWNADITQVFQELLRRLAAKK